MKKALSFGVAGLALSVGMLGFGYYAGQQPRGSEAQAVEGPGVEGSMAASGPLDRSAVEGIVRDYLIANPEIMVEVQAALENRQQEQQRETQLATIEAASDEIFNASYDGVIGNPNGKVSVVEFFDYNCGYCKRALSDMEGLVSANPDVRFVLKEFPILGPDSQKAHVVSMAFRALVPEKFGDFHRQLMAAPGTHGEASAMKIALALGADEAALRREMQNPAITEAFGKTYELANKLAITGTPSYVVGKEVVFGALGREVLEEKVASARTCDTGAC
jgi:protein-disulfide isomerase